MSELYKAIAGSPITYLAADISANQTTISIADDSALPDAPNICTIGYGENIETIRYGAKSNGVLQNVTRGLEGTPRAWKAGTEVARFYTAYEHNAIVETIESHLADFASYGFGSRPYTATYTELYLDEVNGDDNNNGLTQNTAVKTWSKVHSLIPVFLTSNLTIKIIGDYSGTILISGIFSAGNIYDRNIIIEGITQNKDNHNISYLRMTNVLVPITVRHLTINSTISNIMTACLAPTFQYVTINIDSATLPAIRGDKGNLTVRDSEINSTGHACILAGELGVVVSRDNTGQGMHGLRVFPGGTIIKYGTQPTGTAANEVVDTGGLIR